MKQDKNFYIGNALKNKKGVLQPVVAGAIVFGVIIFVIFMVSTMINLSKTAEETTKAIKTLAVSGVTGTTTVTVDDVEGCIVPTGTHGESLSGASIVAYNQQASGTPAVTPGIWVYGVTDGVKYHDGDSFTSAQTWSRPGVGNVVDVYGGGNTSIFVQPKFKQCINSRSPRIELDAHDLISPEGLKVTVYDDTDKELTANFNQSQEDYVLDMNAGSEDEIRVQLKVNVSDKAYILKGFALGVDNEVDALDYDSVYSVSGIRSDQLLKPDGTSVGSLADLDFEKSTCPDNISDTKLSADEGAFTYDECWVITNDNVLLMEENDKITLSFWIEADADTAPASTNTSADDDAAFLSFFDANYAEGDDGNMYLDFYAHTDTEVGVGIVENASSPLGRTHGFRLMGI